MAVGHDVAALVQQRMHQVTRYHTIQSWNELGTMQSDMSLLTASGIVVAKGDYLLSRFVQQPPTQNALVGLVCETAGPLVHDHLFLALNPGDTVLVNWVDGGTRAVIAYPVGAQT